MPCIHEAEFADSIYCRCDLLDYQKLYQCNKDEQGCYEEAQP